MELQGITMGRGGVRVGAGRRTGTSDRQMRKINVDQVLNAIGSGPDKTPLAYLLGIMSSPTDDIKLSERIQCAIAAAPYVHPRLASVEVKGDAAAPLQVQSDIGQALKALAELARTRTIDLEPEPDLLEAGTWTE